jgi:exopolyphosphatase/guanosine-5'-triphosphate,3'-diphosphate pyrophosphatase
VKKVAVIDIGSNSIKLLVAQKSAEGHISALIEETSQTRISKGISQANPRLSESAINAGIQAIQTLCQRANTYQPCPLTLVATSAVRDAANGLEFAERVEATTTNPVTILSGDEEARLIGRGVIEDPEIPRNEPFFLIDLGGGSLELLEFEHNRCVQKTSLPLGAVRLTERYLAAPDALITDTIAIQISETITNTIQKSGFTFVNRSQRMVGTGGALTHTRLFINRENACESNPLITFGALQNVFDHIAHKPIDERIALGIPAGRADIMPVALLTLLTLLRLARVEHIHHSFYNLRYGIAAEMLNK